MPGVEFSQVAMQARFAGVEIAPCDSTFQNREKPFHRIGVGGHAFDRQFVGAMVDDVASNVAVLWQY